MVADAEHPNASVTFTVYVPEVSPDASKLFPPEGIQLIVYGNVPNDACAIATPLLPPKQEAELEDEIDTEGPGILVIDEESMAIQLCESVTCNVYVPCPTPLKLAFTDVTGDHK